MRIVERIAPSEGCRTPISPFPRCDVGRASGPSHSYGLLSAGPVGGVNRNLEIIINYANSRIYL
ncbi:protein of unknown function [Methylocella tundrae]|uniref:Uncharacterized protein n=1 Tax=Methylocella tundrae TaxID=227605 RepID=A0A4U8Z608_METTU|nr:protein of unknown function [Methylocella tundrae]